MKRHFPAPRDAVAYILDQFPIVRRKDEAAFGRYRTKDRILEIYDAMLVAQVQQSALSKPARPASRDTGAIMISKVSIQNFKRFRERDRVRAEAGTA